MRKGTGLKDWEDREGKGIRGEEAKELTQLPFSGGHVSLEGQQ